GFPVGCVDMLVAVNAGLDVCVMMVCREVGELEGRAKTSTLIILATRSMQVAAKMNSVRFELNLLRLLVLTGGGAAMRLAPVADCSPELTEEVIVGSSSPVKNMLPSAGGSGVIGPCPANGVCITGGSGVT